MDLTTLPPVLLKLVIYFGQECAPGSGTAPSAVFESEELSHGTKSHDVLLL